MIDFGSSCSLSLSILCLYAYALLLFFCVFRVFSFGKSSPLFLCSLFVVFRFALQNYNVPYNLCRSQTHDILLFVYSYSYINLKCIQFVILRCLYHRVYSFLGFAFILVRCAVFVFCSSQSDANAENFCLISFHVSVALIFINFCVSSVQFSSLFHIQTRTRRLSI